MTSTSAFILAIAVLALCGITGILSGVFWRRSYDLPRFFSIIGVVLAALGTWLVVIQKAPLTEWGTIIEWPSVQGIVVSSKITGERAVHPEIVYEYIVSGTTYRDTTGFDTPSFGGRNVRRDAAEAIAANYPVGSPVIVHYDPKLPLRSQLRTSPDWSLFGKTGLGGTLVGIGCFLVFGTRHRQR